MKINYKMPQRISLEFLLIVFFSAYYIMPSFSIRINYTVFLGAAFFYLLVCLYREKVISGSFAICILSIVFLAAYYAAFVDTATISIYASNRTLKHFSSKLYQYSMMFLPVLFLKWSEYRATDKEKNFIIGISYLMIFFVMIKTVRELGLNSNVTREWLGFIENGQNNIAGYSFIYAIPFVVIICCLFLTDKRNVFSKIIVTVLVVFQLYFLIVSQYTLSLLIAVLGFVILSFERIKSKIVKVLLIVFLPALIIAFPYLVKIVAGFVPSEQMSVRLYEVSSFFLNGGEMGYNLNGRLTLYWKTILAFIKSPIFGNSTLDFDGHATFLVILADVGLIGGIPFFYLFRTAKRTVNFIMKNNKNYNVFWSMLIMMGLTNPIHNALQVMYAIWFLIPLTLNLIKKEKCGEDDAGLEK